MKVFETFISLQMNQEKNIAQLSNIFDIGITTQAGNLSGIQNADDLANVRKNLECQCIDKAA